MDDVYLWHIEKAEPLDLIQLSALDASTLVLAPFRATHVPMSARGPIGHPMRRTSINIWAQVALDENAIRSIRERCGWDNPIWIGLPFCCQRPSFWGIDGDETLPPVPSGVSTEGAAWAAERVYVAKPDTWFTGACVLIDDYRPRLNSGLFRGQRRCENPDAEGRALGEVYEDEEVCDFDEFDQ